MQCLARSLRAAGTTVGFVPTMGSLHEGHLSLARAAGRENDVVVVSIFVNPTQFGPAEDFGAYPRDLEADLAVAESADVDYVFHPQPAGMYPTRQLTWVTVDELTDGLCGASRPGHFRGVTTVVAKLFNLVQPTRAYFGEKDFQQLVVIEQMVRELDFDVEIVRCPLIREPDGLALSSRNAYLSDAERKAALALYRSLQRAQERVCGGCKDPVRLRQEVVEFLSGEPLAETEYVEIVDSRDLQAVGGIDEHSRLLLAVRIGDTRLIDNALLKG
jgi:pantoate--beta-alanine ligase